MTRTVRASGLFVVLILALALVLLVWNGQSRVRDYRAHQTDMAMRGARAAASEIALQIEELRRRVHLFAEQEAELIGQLAAHPEDQVRREQLAARLDRHFSDRISFAVVSAAGKTLVDDVDNLIGDLCVVDIAQFAAGDHPNRVYIHPQPGAYHFDLMARIDHPGRESQVFFVSFHPTVVARLLGSHAPERHELLLLRESVSGVIEVSAEGARDQIKREPQLAPGEVARIAAVVPVPGTDWLLADLPDAGLESRARQAIWRETGLFVVALTLVALFMLRFLKLSERQRFAAEDQLRRAQHELELRVRDRTQRLTHANSELQRQIRERRVAERNLREQEGTLRAILDSAVDAIVVIDDHAVIRIFNGAAERMFGYSNEEAVGQNVNLLMPSPWREEHDGHLRRYLETGERRVIGIGREAQALHRDGTTFPVHIAVSEVDLGNRKLFAGVLRNLGAGGGAGPAAGNGPRRRKDAENDR